MGPVVALQEQLAGGARGPLGQLDVGQSARAITTISVSTPKKIAT
jgi:hypothetical protein